MFGRFLKNLATVAVSLALTALVFEAVLQFLPVHQGFQSVAVNQTQPVFHARPARIVTSSRDWDFFNARDVRVNNVGFRNDQDYTVEGRHPLIAVVGDSYVESLQVDYADSFFARLAADLDGRARVYSFGFSGAPLSQYLVWARYARDTFQADYLVVVVISNDFDESLGVWKRGQGFHHYEACTEADYCLTRVDYEPAVYRPLVEASALGRYLLYNLQILEIGRKIELFLQGSGEGDGPRFVGNVEVEVDPKRLEDSLLAIELFFRDLPAYAGLPPERICLVVDGRVYDETRDVFDESFFGRTRRNFMEQARAGGYDVIDLVPIFAEHFARHGESFESERDGHWNELGHAVVADALAAYYDGRLTAPSP